MKMMELKKAFTLIEPGPVVLITTNDGNKHNMMTLSWTMVVDFTPRFAITTGDWNYSYGALKKFKECVIAIPTAEQIDQVVGIGLCSGRDTDKFLKFGLTPIEGQNGRAPLIKECLANIECKVVDFIKKHDIIILEGIAAYFNSSKKIKQTLHAVGDGTFIIDGKKLNRKKVLRTKLEGINWN